MSIDKPITHAGDFLNSLGGGNQSGKAFGPGKMGTSRKQRVVRYKRRSNSDLVTLNIYQERPRQDVRKFLELLQTGKSSQKYRNTSFSEEN